MPTYNSINSLKCVLLIPFMYFSYIFILNTNLKMFPEICCFKWHVVSFFPNRKNTLVEFISTQSILWHWWFLWWCHVSICSEQAKESFYLSKITRLQVSCTSSYYYFLIWILKAFLILVSSQDKISYTLLCFCLHHDISYFSSCTGGKGGDLTTLVTLRVGKICFASSSSLILSVTRCKCSYFTTNLISHKC